jgi:hypothetical protein
MEKGFCCIAVQARIVGCLGPPAAPPTTKFSTMQCGLVKQSGGCTHGSQFSAPAVDRCWSVPCRQLATPPSEHHTCIRQQHSCREANLS